MAASNVGSFAQALRHGSAICTALKTTYGDSANAVSLLVAGPQGTRIDSIGALTRATITATQVIILDFDGANYNVCAYGLMTAYTMAATTLPPSTTFFKADGSGQILPSNPLYLPIGHTLYAGIMVALAGGVVVSCDAVDF